MYAIRSYYGTGDLCDICDDDRRANGEICVVEDVSDLWAMERAGVFKGRYHVLGGTLSALDGIGPEDLRIPALVTRVGDEQIRVITSYSIHYTKLYDSLMLSIQAMCE